MALTDNGNASLSCGQVVHGNVNLTAHLVCTGDGLIVGEDNTFINLNGYSIEGISDNSKKVGIAIPHSNNVSISGPGKITYFQAGVLATGSVGTQIHDLKSQENKIGIFMTNTIDSTVEQNDIRSNTLGVASHSSRGIEVHNNIINGNELGGISFVATLKSQIDGNSISENNYGIYLSENSSKNKILNNTVLDNDIDINNADGVAIEINQNEFNNNKCNTSDPESLCRK